MIGNITFGSAGGAGDVSIKSLRTWVQERMPGYSIVENKKGHSRQSHPLAIVDPN